MSIKKIFRKDKYLYLIFLLPFLYFMIFLYAPMYGVLIAFKDYNVFDGIFKSDWVGFKYFIDFMPDPYFWKILRNTVMLSVLYLIWGFPAPIILALLLNELRNQRFKKLVQTVSYLPHFISVVVICGMVVNFLSYDGPVNKVLTTMGIEPIRFLLQPEWFRTIYIGSEIWAYAGWGAIIYLASLAGIDIQLYEAAIVDGAGRWKQLLHVTLPGIAPTITVMFILNVGKVMNVGFEKILLLYQPATYETADVIATYVYRRGLIGSDFSYATAVGLFNSVVGLILIVLTNRLAKKIGETSLW